jgi:predicted nuclease of predicted toxin-antitoxin system
MNSSELRFIVDVGVGKGIEKYLREEGYNTKAVRNIDPRMEDEEIIRTAVSENRIVITMDKDFGELVYHSSMEHSGVLLPRLEDAVGSEKLQVVKHIMKNYSDRIKNCFCVFQNDKLRIRKINR